MNIDKNVIKNIYDRLQDGLSHDVFTARLMYFLTEDEEHIWKLSDMLYNEGNYTHKIEELIALKKSGRKIIFYGAGTRGRRCKVFSSRHGLHADVFCDKSLNKQKNGFLDLPVITPNELTTMYGSSIVVITASPVYADEIKHDLRKLGFTSNIYDFFSDDRKWSYFEYDFLQPVENEVYVDCGVLDGDTIKEFINFSNGKYKKIFGFEPDTKSYRRTLDNLHGYERVQVYNKGVWSEETELLFTELGDGGSNINADGTVKIPVTMIDKMVGDDVVTLIKMDIEGAELEALKGAAKTIKRCKPRCAISIYHKPEDIIELPFYLQSLVPEYKFYLRQQSVLGNAETVLYALVE